MGWVHNAPDNVRTYGRSLVGVGLGMLGLALATLLLRLYVRLKMIKASGWDDLIIIISWIGAAGYTLSMVIQTRWGLGLTELKDMPDENQYMFGLLQYIGAAWYVLGIWGFKMSLLLSYCRFMPKGLYQTLNIAAMVVISMGHIAFICVFLFMCDPIAANWDPAITDKHCLDAVPFYLTFSSLTIIFDISVLIFPFPLLISSKIQRRKKVVLLGLFGLGVFVTIIQIIRIQTITSLVNYLDSAKSIIWSIVENCLGIIIANIPTLAPLVKYFSERTRSSRSGNSRQTPGGSRYGLHTLKSAKSGMRPLGSREGHENTTTVHASSDSQRSSADIIPEPTAGIVKTTDVMVTSQFRGGDVESQRAGSTSRLEGDYK